MDTYMPKRLPSREQSLDQNADHATNIEDRRLYGCLD